MRVFRLERWTLDTWIDCYGPSRPRRRIDIRKSQLSPPGYSQFWIRHRLLPATELPSRDGRGWQDWKGCSSEPYRSGRLLTLLWSTTSPSTEKLTGLNWSAQTLAGDAGWMAATSRWMQCRPGAMCFRC